MQAASGSWRLTQQFLPCLVTAVLVYYLFAPWQAGMLALLLLASVATGFQTETVAADFFSQQLEAANIPHELLTFERGHGNLVGWAREVMLPFFSNVLVSE